MTTPFTTVRSTLLSAMGVSALSLLVSVSITFACPNWIGTKLVPVSGPGNVKLGGNIQINGGWYKPVGDGIGAPTFGEVCIWGWTGVSCQSTAPAVGTPVSSQSSSTVTPDASGGEIIPDPTFDISAQPLLVRFGGSSTITWSASNAENCTVTGPNLSASGSSGSQVVNNISQRSTYTLQCTALSDGSTIEDSVTVTVAPAWQEF